MSMKRTTLVASVALLAFGTTFTACKKKKTQEDFLKDPAGWVMNKVELNANNGGWTDMTSQVPSCTLDDRIYFQDGGVLKTDEGATKCNASDPQTTTGTWALVENNSKIVMDQDTFNINALTETNINVQSSGVLNGIAMEVRANFVH